MCVNLIVSSNGAGLTRDMGLIADALSRAGIPVSITSLRRGKLRKWFRPWYVRASNALHRMKGTHRPYRINVMLEHVRSEYLSWADINLLVPNPEYLLAADLALLSKIDCIAVKTRHAEVIFKELGHRTAFIGFTSEDRMDAGVPREREFFHLAGKSGSKGTKAVLAAWRAHPHWPRLTVIQNSRSAQAGPPASNITHLVEYISDEQLKLMQNSHRFHLCPSETEGFGHYLMEALSVGAVTLTTNGEPMNELVSQERGVLISVALTGTQALATTWLAKPAEIAVAVERALALDEAECQALGEAARQFFVDSDAAFSRRMVELVRAWL